jgi:hypothetical protein
MNCFNIREIQTLLKTRFYADLLNESHQHIFLNRTTPGLRFKTQDLNFLNSCQVILQKYGILTTPSSRTQVYNSSFESALFVPNVISASTGSMFSPMFSTMYYSAMTFLSPSN